MPEQACAEVLGKSIISEELEEEILREFSDSNIYETLLKILQGNSLLELSIFLLSECQNPSIGSSLIKISRDKVLFEEEMEKKKQRIINLSIRATNLG